MTPEHNPTGPLGQTLLDALSKLAGRRVLIVGDVMLDHYLAGQVDRISPEAPVPVVHVTDEWRRLGGAGNVARNIATLGGAPTLVGLVGEDNDGALLEKLLTECGVTARLVRSPGRPTIIKTRVIAHNQQVVRVDKEQKGQVAVDVTANLLAALSDRIADYDVVVLSDYGKGVVNAAFMDGLRSLLAGMATPPLLLVDPAVKHYDLYTGVDMITPNTKEAGEGAGTFIDGRDDVLKTGLALFKRLRLRHLLITLGPEGMALFEKPDLVRHIPTFARNVYDVTGAGDTVIATLALGLAAGLDLSLASLLANYAAGIVVGQVGTASTSVEELADAIRRLPEPEISTWLGESR